MQFKQHIIGQVTVTFPACFLIYEMESDPMSALQHPRGSWSTAFCLRFSWHLRQWIRTEMGLELQQGPGSDMGQRDEA